MMGGLRESVVSVSIRSADANTVESAPFRMAFCDWYLERERQGPIPADEAIGMAELLRDLHNVRNAA